MKKTSWLAISFQMLLVFFLFTLNHTVGLIKNPNSYSPFSIGTTISALTYDESYLYSTGPRRFMRDQSLPSDSDIYELRNVVSGVPVLHSILIGSIGIVFGSLENAWMFLHGLLPVLLWLLVVYFLLESGIDLFTSSILAWFTIIFPFGPRNALLMGQHALFQPLEMSRMPQPALSFTLMFFSTVLIIRALCSGRRQDVGLAGVILGLNFYCYYYYYVGLFLALGFLFLAFIVQRHFPLAKRTFQIVAVGIVTGIPYFYRLVLGAKQGGQAEYMLRVGEFTREISISGLVQFLIIAAVFSIYLFRSKDKLGGKTPAYFNVQILTLLSLGVAGTFGLNFHVITGYNPQHSHFSSRLIQPILFLIFCIIIGRTRLFANLLAVRLLACILAVAVVCMAGIRQYKTALTTLDAHRTDTSRRELLTWVRDNVKADQVVGTTDIELLSLLPSISGTWTYIPVGARTMGTHTEILTRYLTVAKLEQRSLEDVKTALQHHWPDEERLWLHNSYVFFTQNILAPSILKEIELLWGDLSPSQELSSRKLDYLIIPQKQDITSLSQFKSKKSIYSNLDWNLVQVF